MIRRCCGEWSSIMTSCQKQGLLGTCSLRFCSVRIKQRSRSRKDGLFLVGSTLMEIIALCRLLTLTLFFPTVVSDQKSLSSPPCSFLFFSSSSSSQRKKPDWWVLPLTMILCPVWLGLVRLNGGVVYTLFMVLYVSQKSLIFSYFFIVYSFQLQLPCVPFLFSFSLCS